MHSTIFCTHSPHDSSSNNLLPISLMWGCLGGGSGGYNTARSLRRNIQCFCIPSLYFFAFFLFLMRKKNNWGKQNEENENTIVSWWWSYRLKYISVLGINSPSSITRKWRWSDKKRLTNLIRIVSSLFFIYDLNQSTTTIFLYFSCLFIFRQPFSWK